jgi:integrase
MRPAVILARVSSAEQEAGHSLEAQLSNLQEYASRHELEVIHVLTDEGKTFFENSVLNKQGSDFVFVREGGQPWGNSHQKRPIIEACKNAKIKPAISFHVLRHTHGSLLAMKGVPMPVIAKQLGHADTRMTEKHYAHLSPSYVADTIRQNFPTLGTVQENNVTALKGKK